MDGLDDLEKLAKRAESAEKSEAEAERAEFEEVPEAAAADAPPPPEAIDAGANRAEAFLRICEGGVQMFLDDRVALAPEEVEEGRAKMGPALAKHDLAGEGSGNIPYQEEVVAGFFVGGMIKRLIRRIKELRAFDKAKAKQAEREARAGGDQREQSTQQQSHSVSGEVGVWQDSDVAPPIAD